MCLGSQSFDFVAGRFTRGIAGRPLLARLQEVLGPAIIEGLVDALVAAQLSHAVLAAQAGDHDPDLVLSREVSPVARLISRTARYLENNFKLPEGEDLPVTKLGKNIAC